MTSKQSLEDTPIDLLKDRIEWLNRESAHIRMELLAARAELKKRGKKS